LRPFTGLLNPASTERLVEMNHGLHARKCDLRELVLRREQSLLRLKHGKQIGSTLAVLKLSYPKGLPRGIDLTFKVIAGVAIVLYLVQRSLHVAISAEDSTLIARDQFLLRCSREISLPHQLSAIEDGL
jgi:hypothetical protein